MDLENFRVVSQSQPSPSAGGGGGVSEGYPLGLPTKRDLKSRAPA